MLLETQFAKETKRIRRQDFASAAIRIEGKGDCDKAAHEMGIAVAPIVQHFFARRIDALAELQPHLADAAANLVRIIVGGLVQGLERAAELEDIAIAVFPIVEKGKVAADGIEACQRGVLRWRRPLYRDALS